MNKTFLFLVLLFNVATSLGGDRFGLRRRGVSKEAVQRGFIQDEEVGIRTT